MRLATVLLAGILVSPNNSQAPPITVTRDAEALTLLQQSVAAMAKIPPSDSSATGIVSVVEGSTSQDGTIHILTLGTGATSETISLPGGQRVVTYSNGAAKETNGTQSLIAPMELALSDQSPDFPLPFLTSALGNSEESTHYIALETLDGQPAHHIQVWNTFASKPRLQTLSPFSLKDIWLDAASNLPLKISYSRRGGGQGVPVFSVEILFSNYTSSKGVLYPFRIDKCFNGVLWQTITIQQVAFNTGLTEAQFPVE